MTFKNVRILTTAIAAMTLAAQAPADEAPLPETIVRPYVTKLLADRCGADQPLFIHQALEFDVNHDGLVDIVYNATSCLAAKGGGPDQHGILLQQKDKSYVRAKFADIDKNLRATLIGPVGYEFAIEGNQVVQYFSDSSERHHPLTVFLLWNKDSLVIGKSQRAPLYPTSYDCQHLAKNSSALADFAVCSVKRLATLDRMVGDAFKRAPNSGAKKTLKNFREARITACPLVPGWVDCFEKSYLSELDVLGFPMMLGLESKCGKGGFYFASMAREGDRENLKFVLRYLHSGAVVNDTPFEDQIKETDRITPAFFKAKLSDPLFEKWGSPVLVKNLQLLSISRYALESSCKDLPTGPALLATPPVKNYLKNKKEVLAQLQSRFGVVGVENAGECH